MSSVGYIDKDTAGAVSFNDATTTEGVIHYTGSDDYTADADTKGRLEGTLLNMRCYKANEWYVTGLLTGDGAVGNPFS